ncbi:MAG TPA: MlaD family protein [Gemmatimonadales bacterium]|nr:MlaD family protein [Gemmatimonadales bacterium]
MSLSERQADTLVGALVVGVALVLAVAVYFTLGWNQRRWDLYITAASAQDLNADTKVFLQGLEVGRVAAVNPRIDGAHGALSFLVRVRIDQHFEDGSPVRLPVGTTAEIAAASALGGAVISLNTPAAASGAMLNPDDTIGSVRHTTPLDQIAQVADSLARQVSLVLTDTRTVLQDVDGTVRLVHRQVNDAAPALQRSIAGVAATLAELQPLLRHADTLVSSADGHFRVLQDSLVRTLGTAHALTLHLDSLVNLARTMGTENREDIRATVANLQATSAQLEYFVDQVSRRPLRMLSGVHPPPPDSARAHAAAGGGQQ